MSDDSSFLLATCLLLQVELTDCALELLFSSRFAVGVTTIQQIQPVERTKSNGRQKTHPFLNKGTSIRETYQGGDKCQKTQHHPNEDNDGGKSGDRFVRFDNNQLFFVSIHCAFFLNGKNIFLFEN